jgi:cyclohexanone monooxygenase
MSGATPDVRDAVVIGAGFSGLYMLHRLRGQGVDVRGFEAGSDVGGTWYWNRYPGARCDVESVVYSYSFSPELEQEWEWSERYPTQPELLRYIQHVADRFDLRGLISFDTRVVSADYDEGRDVWMVATDSGERIEARYLVTAVGCLSTARIPDIPGLDDFAGTTFHTGHWPHDGVDFTGQRVGIIGTGSSGIQAIPEIAAQADRLEVFQRTPTFTVPAHNRPLEPSEVQAVKAGYPALREANRWSPGGSDTNTLERGILEHEPEERLAELERRWEHGGAIFVAAFPDAMVDLDANEVVAEFVRDKIRTIVQDPVTAAKLSPSSYPIGAKRI